MPKTNPSASQKLEAAMTLAFAQELREMAENQIDRENFASIVQRAVRKFGIPQVDFSSEFGVTTGTVSKWTHGTACPGNHMKKEIFKWIAGVVERDPIVASVDGKANLRGLIARAEVIASGKPDMAA